MFRVARRLAGGALLLSACQSRPAAVDDAAADQSAAAVEDVRVADLAWQRAFASRDTAVAVDFVEPSGSLLPANAPIADGHDAVKAVFKTFWALPNMTLQWTPAEVQAARSGELAYSQGSYELSYTDASGQPVSDHGKYVTLWRKQPNGSWKVALNIFNSDLPPRPM